MTKEKYQQLKPGDMVVAGEESSVGEIIYVNEKYAVVNFQHAEMRISRNFLRKATPPEKAKAATKKQPTINRPAIVIDNFISFDATIDLHGMSVQEALRSMDQWIDQGYLSGHKRLKVIHGKGSGILRSAVRSHLQSHAQVKHIIIHHTYFGGEGVTWLDLI